MTKELEIEYLKAENKSLMMRLSAIKAITSMIQPACTKKLEELLTGACGCQGEEDK